MQTFTYKPSNIIFSSPGILGATIAGLGAILTPAETRSYAELSSTDNPTFADLTLTGKLQTKTGSSSAPAITASDANSGMYWRGSDDVICFATTGVPLITISNSYTPLQSVNLANSIIFGWSSNANPELAFQDTAFARVSAGIVELNDGTRVSSGGTLGSLYVGTV